MKSLNELPLARAVDTFLMEESLKVDFLRGCNIKGEFAYGSCVSYRFHYSEEDTGAGFGAATVTLDYSSSPVCVSVYFSGRSGPSFDVDPSRWLSFVQGISALLLSLKTFLGRYPHESHPQPSSQINL